MSNKHPIISGPLDLWSLARQECFYALQSRCHRLLLASALVVVGGLWQSASAQMRMEYFWNTDPGIGKATAIWPDVDQTGIDWDNPSQTVYVESDNLPIDAEISVTDIPYGVNLLGMRAVITKTVDGESRTFYSPTYCQYVYKVNFTSQDPVNYLEYFFVPAHHAGDMTIHRIDVDADDEGNFVFEIPEKEMHLGLNHLGMRLVGINADGITHYSPVTFREVYRVRKPDSYLSYVEYFLNEDPGLGKATVAFTSDVDPNSDFPEFARAAAPESGGMECNFEIPVDELRTGVNVLGIRSVSNGSGGIHYSPTTYRFVYKPANLETVNVEEIEYFWDTDPGIGHGHKVQFTPGTLVELDGIDIDHGGIYGKHTLYVRARAGNVWTETIKQEVDLELLIVGTVTLDPEVADQPEQNLYQSLQSLLGNLHYCGFATGLHVDVADATYTYEVSETMLPILMGLADTLVAKNLYIDMVAENSATFLFTVSREFLMAHAAEAAQLAGYVQQLFSHVLTTNITLLVNGEMVAYDGFQIEPNDLLDLKAIYNNLGGEQWTGKRWSFISNGRDASEFPGVKFEGNRVQEIDLSGNNLEGELSSKWTVYMPVLTLLNLSNNKITGDLAPFVTNLSSLKTLYMQNNRLTEISAPLPESVAFFSVWSQWREYVEGQYDEYFFTANIISSMALKPVQIWVSQRQKLTLPSLFTYCMEDNYSGTTVFRLFNKTPNRDDYQGFADSEELRVYKEDDETYFSYQRWGVGSALPEIYTYPQAHPITMIASSGDACYSAYPALLNYIEGDANMSGYTDVLDVQQTLNFIMLPWLSWESGLTCFNHSAANTYADSLINVQDIVCTVNIVLDNEEAASSRMGGTSALARGQQRSGASSAKAWLYARDERLRLFNEGEVGAKAVDLEGVKTSQVSLLLNNNDYQLQGRNTSTGSRYVIFSLSGKPIPAGENVLLRMSGDAQPIGVQVSDMRAEEVAAAIAMPTGIRSVRTAADVALSARIDGGKLVVVSSEEMSGVTLRLFTSGGTLLLQSRHDVLCKGETTVSTTLPAGIYMLQATAADGTKRQFKLIKK